MQERAFWTKEVAERLGIGTSTLRKWCLGLEEGGYSFVKGAKNSRAFVERDITILERMKELIQQTGMSIEGSVKVVLSTSHPIKEHEEQESVPKENDRTPIVREENTSVEFVQQFIHSQQQLIERIEQLEQIERTNSERLKRMEERYEERDSLFMSHVRDIQETRKLLAASQEPRRKWWEFWK